MNYTNPQWSSNDLKLINEAAEGKLTLFGKKAVLLPTLPLKEEDRVAPSPTTVKMVAEHLRDTGNWYRWDSNLGGIPQVAFITRDGTPNLMWNWLDFRTLLTNEFVFVSFTPGRTDAIERRVNNVVSGHEVMVILSALVHGTVLKKINWSAIAEFKVERRQPEIKPVVVVKREDPASISNRAYLEVLSK